ncbi:permease, partial [Patescibacteria group bacterium]|nr:permease [Patescibacteria group bacterium]
VAIGIPLYSNAAGTIPIVKSLIEKGLPIGTSLAFMMAVTALSLPEMIILRRVLKLKLLVIYITILALGIMFTGYLFNAIL